MMKRRFALLLMVVCAMAATAIAYGPDGHEIVGGIADKRLANTPTGAKIAALIDGIPLARAANMPDEIKSWDRNGAGDLEAYPHYSQKRIEEQLRTFWTANPPTDDHNSAIPSHHWFHYTDVPVMNVVKYRDGKTGRSQWDIVHMMRFCVQVLKGEVPEDNPRKITKLVSVLLLAHYVGDVHQPLHVGAEYFAANGNKTDPDRSGQAALEDQGGNSILLELPAGGGYAEKKGKLHSYWDSDPVFALFPSLPRDLKGKERSEAIKGPKQELIAKLAQTEPANWRTPASVQPEDYGEVWANEILPQAREAHERLRFVNVHRQPEMNSNVAEGTAMEQPAPDHLSYRDWSARVVREDLHKAGWRLADMMEKIFANTSATAAATPAAALTSPAPTALPSATAFATAPPIATGQSSPNGQTPLPSASAAPSVPGDPVYGEYPRDTRAS